MNKTIHLGIALLDVCTYTDYSDVYIYVRPGYTMDKIHLDHEQRKQLIEFLGGKYVDQPTPEDHS